MRQVPNTLGTLTKLVKSIYSMNYKGVSKLVQDILKGDTDAKDKRKRRGKKGTEEPLVHHLLYNLLSIESRINVPAYMR